MARKTYRRKTHRRRRQTRKRGGACGPCMANRLVQGGYRGYTTGAAATYSQMTGETAGLSSGGNRRNRNRN